MLTKIKTILREIIDFGLLLIAIAIILELLFGPTNPFLGKNIIDNLVNLVFRWFIRKRLFRRNTESLKFFA